MPSRVEEFELEIPIGSMVVGAGPRGGKLEYTHSDTVTALRVARDWCVHREVMPLCGFLRKPGWSVALIANGMLISPYAVPSKAEAIRKCLAVQKAYEKAGSPKVGRNKLKPGKAFMASGPALMKAWNETR
jgi:hypothetical protein